MNYFFILVIFSLIITLSLIKPYESFLIDDLIDYLKNDPPCLLTDGIKTDYDNKGKDYCSILSEKMCNKCSNNCMWYSDRCIKKNNTLLNNSSNTTYESECKNNCSSTCKSPDGWDLTENTCNKCENCGWCIDNDYDGTCVKPDKNVHDNRPSKCTLGWEYQCVNYGKSGNIPKSKTCYMGINQKQPLKNQYATIGCNLYNYYEDCLKCKDLGKCSVYSTNGEVKCEKCKYGKKPNCLSSPTDGFGCPGQDFISDNIPPINPINNNGVVCRYIEK